MIERELSWQRSFADAWCTTVQQGRTPHAIVLAGPVGVGKRAAAAWLAMRTLHFDNVPDVPTFPPVRPEHADLRWISTPEDKKSIGIEQIRSLVDALSLTSYEGHGKVAVIEPANDMTANAANSLLKTLEEPPGNALLVLVVDRIGKLPATVFSRCQRIELPVPTQAEALDWLDRWQPGTAWAEPLRLAGGAPLAAIAVEQQLDTSKALAQDLVVLGQGKGSPVEVAARWAKLDPGFVLDWLAQQMQLLVLAAHAGRNSAAGLAIDESVLRRMDTRNLFCYLDIINRLRGQSGGSYNVQLALEGLLIDWADGLRDCDLKPPVEGMELISTQ